MRSAIQVFGRTFWRPSSFALAAVVDVGDDAADFPAQDFSAFPNSVQDEMRAVLWMECTAVAAFVGALVAGGIQGVHTRQFAFIVPSMREKLFTGKLIVGIALSLVAGIFGYAAFGARDAALMMTCAFGFYCLGGLLVDMVTPRFLVLPGFALFFAMLYRPEPVAVAFERAPLMLGVGAVLFAAWSISREGSVDLARQRTLLTLGPGQRARWGRLDVSEWRGRPATGRLRDWIAATDYENLVSRLGYRLNSIWHPLLMVVFAHAMSNPSFVLIMGFMMLSTEGHRLTRLWTYPIARQDRADLAFVCSLLDSLLYFLPAAALLYALDAAGAPRLPGFALPDDSRFPLWAPLVGILWAPVAQWIFHWSGRRFRKGDTKPFEFWWRSTLHLLVSVVLSLVTVRLLSRTTLGAAVVSGVLLGTAVQYLYWRALRWQFGRGDLA